MQFFPFSVPVRLVWATEGDNVELPCDITPPTPEDSVNMVLWFKDDAGIPLYRQVLQVLKIILPRSNYFYMALMPQS